MRRKLKLDELHRISIAAFKLSPKTPLILLLDNIRSLNNIGAIFRSADSFRIAKIYLCGITACPPHREIHKTAIGATESVEWVYSPSALKAVEQLKAERWKVYAVEQTQGAIALDDFHPTSDPLALVFGNEVEGVQQAVIDQCDGTIEVPQIGTKHSLNVSVCAGIVLWDVFAKMNRSKRG